MSETGQIKVLIFETDDSFRRNIYERMQLGGVIVFESGDEAEATGIALDHNIDVVLLGRKGVRESGLPFLKFIKTTSPLTEVILITSPNEESLLISMEAMKLGAFDDLCTPLDMEMLLTRIYAAGKQKRETEEAMWRHSRCERSERPDSSSSEARTEKGIPSVESYYTKRQSQYAGKKHVKRARRLFEHE